MAEGCGWGGAGMRSRRAVGVSGGEELAGAIGADAHGLGNAGVGEARAAEALGGIAGRFGEEIRQGDEDDEWQQQEPDSCGDG